MKKRLVISATQYQEKSSGIGILIYELFGRLAQHPGREAAVLLSADSPPFPQGQARQIRIPVKKGRALLRGLYESLWMGRRYCKNCLYLTTDSKIPLLLPPSCQVIPVVTDLALLRMGEVYRAARVWYWRPQYRLLRKRAVCYGAISPFTKEEMTRLLAIPAEKIHVIPCAADPALRRVEDKKTLEAVRERYGLPERYLLFVGNFNPRKNLTRLMEAFDLLKSRPAGAGWKLVIAGEQGWKFDREKALAAIRCRKDVLFPGYVAREDLGALYSMAGAFLFPSLYEGFGIPVIEAQQCGAPVICSGTSALPQVAGRGALYVDPMDPEDICCQIYRLLTDPALGNQLRQAGYENASRFSWERSAKALAELLEQLP